MKTYSPPSPIEDRGEVLDRVGDGETRGSLLYRSRWNGRTAEYFIARCVKKGPHFATLDVLGNPMPDCELDRPPGWLAPGHIVLICLPHREGPLWKTAGMWPVKVTDKPVARIVGTIHAVKSPKFGFATADKNGRQCRVDVEHLLSGARLVVGDRISYEELLGECGYYAAKVQRILGETFPQMRLA
jgi:hypothetical protein